MTGFFVAGTDTGVGKTFVSCALARLVVKNGKRVFGFKPVESGGAEDQQALVAAAGCWQTGELAGAYTLNHPVAPAVAAREEGIDIDVQHIVRVYRRGAALADFSIVEGAGGWRVPLTDSEDMATLARAIELPVIVVARATLGTINHTLLTIEAVERDRCRLAGVVVSLRPGEDLAFAESNRSEISRRCAGPVVLLSTDAEELAPFMRFP